MKKISFDDFVEKYKPVKNHLDENAAFDGTMFETFGDEVQHVVKIANANPTRVWTFLSGDGDYIVSGYNLVNRVGYFLTEVCAEDDIEITLNDSKEYGLKPEEQELFVEFAKETAKAPYADKDEYFVENLTDELEAYEKNKSDENFENLFRVVSEHVNEYAHFDTEWDNFKKRLV